MFLVQSRLLVSCFPNGAPTGVRQYLKEQEAREQNAMQSAKLVEKTVVCYEVQPAIHQKKAVVAIKKKLAVAIKYRFLALDKKKV